MKFFNSIIDEFNVSIKEVKENKFLFALLFIQLLFFISTIGVFNTDEGLVFNVLGLFLVALYKKKIVLFQLFVILLLFWGINALIFFVGYAPELVLFIGFSIRIVGAYLIIQIFGIRLLFYFETLMFILAVISLPFFIIQVIYPEFFNYFNFINFSTLRRARAGHVNLFVFNFSTWARLRNCGPMSEPAMYGLGLAWASIINVVRNRYKLNERLIVFFVAMLTTISLGTFIYIITILFLVFKNSKQRVSLIAFILVTFVIISVSLVSTSFFNKQKKMILWKLNLEKNFITDIEYGRYSTDLSRITGFMVDIGYIIDNPLGYGLNDLSNKFPYLRKSPNGLSTFIATWGVFGLIVLISGFWKMLIKIGERNSINKIIIL